MLYRPMPGYWYANPVGQLQQVRMVLYRGHDQSRVVIENISGKRQLVDMEAWFRLGLVQHSPRVERRRRIRRDSSNETS